MTQAQPHNTPLNPDLYDWTAHYGRPEKGTLRTIRPSRGEKKLWRKRAKIKPSEWAERYRVLPNTASPPGRWSNARVPYLAGIMDAAFEKCVETVYVCATQQSGKTEFALNALGYIADYSPGPTAYLMPDELTAKENTKDRIIPLFRLSPRLSKYMTGYVKDESGIRLNLLQMSIYMLWAGSEARMASKPVQYIIEDETELYPPNADKLIEKRATTFGGRRKFIKISSPKFETGVIWQGLIKSQAQFEYLARCPHCKTRQLMTFENILWPAEERDPMAIKAGRLARYQCAHCDAQWDDDERVAAIRAGNWYLVEEKEKKERMSVKRAMRKLKPMTIGFRIPSWISPFVSLSEIAADWIEAVAEKRLTGSRVKLQDFYNGRRAEPYIMHAGSDTIDRILKLKDDRPSGIVPSGGIVAGLVAGIDTQDAGFWYEIRAFSYGQEQKSWGIRRGYVLEFEDLEKVLFESEYTALDGKKYHVQMAVMDSQGHRTAEVYNFCVQHRHRIIPFKGEQRMNSPFAWSPLEYFPGGQKQIPGGLRLLRANVTHYKDYLSNKLEVNPADPGAWLYDSELTEEWAKMMISEYRDDKGLWQVKLSRANHGWDCSVYSIIAADVLGLRMLKRPGDQPQPQQARPAQQRPAQTRNETGAGPARPGWMNGRW